MRVVAYDASNKTPAMANRMQDRGEELMMVRLGNTNQGQKNGLILA